MGHFTAGMRMLVCPLVCGMILAGCAGPWKKHQPAEPAPIVSDGGAAGGAPNSAGGTNALATNQKFIVTPETTLTGKVVRVLESARFAVLNFPVGTMPAIDQRLSVYRHGLKVGEVKVTGPREDDNIVADMVTGEVQVGDELRSH